MAEENTVAAKKKETPAVPATLPDSPTVPVVVDVTPFESRLKAASRRVLESASTFCQEAVLQRIEQIERGDLKPESPADPATPVAVPVVTGAPEPAKPLAVVQPTKAAHPCRHFMSAYTQDFRVSGAYGTCRAQDNRPCRFAIQDAKRCKMYQDKLGAGTARPPGVQGK